MSFSRSKALEVNFDRVLSILHGWLGRELLLSLEASHPPQHLVTIRGALAADLAIAEPVAREDFGFTMGTGTFSIRRDCFAGACYYPDADHLTISIDDRTLPADLAAFTLHILRQIS